MSMDSDEGYGSSKSYSKISSWLESEYNIRFDWRSPSRFDALQEQIRACVRAECRRAAEEAATRAFRLAAAALPQDPDEGLYIKSPSIFINTAGLGQVKLTTFNSAVNA